MYIFILYEQTHHEFIKAYFKYNYKISYYFDN